MNGAVAGRTIFCPLAYYVFMTLFLRDSSGFPDCEKVFACVVRKDCSRCGCAKVNSGAITRFGRILRHNQSTKSLCRDMKLGISTRAHCGAEEYCVALTEDLAGA
jgi:hypothetical protein